MLTPVAGHAFGFDDVAARAQAEARAATSSKPNARPATGVSIARVQQQAWRSDRTAGARSVEIGTPGR